MIITLILLIVLIGLVFFFRTYTMESFQNISSSPYMLNSIDMSNCSSKCCPSTFSCDSGCVCLSSEDKHLIAKRGNNTKYSGNLIIP